MKAPTLRTVTGIFIAIGLTALTLPVFGSIAYMVMWGTPGDGSPEIGGPMTLLPGSIAIVLALIGTFGTFYWIAQNVVIGGILFFYRQIVSIPLKS